MKWTVTCNKGHLESSKTIKMVKSGNSGESCLQREPALLLVAVLDSIHREQRKADDVAFRAEDDMSTPSLPRHLSFRAIEYNRLLT